MIGWMWMLACDGETPPAGQPVQSAPTAQTASTSPAPNATDQHQALLNAGVCSSEGTITEVSTHTLRDGRALLEVLCQMSAYQGAYMYAWADGLTPVLDQDGQPLLVVGLPGFDPETGVLSWLSKARGAGDCGDAYQYALRGDRFVSVEHRSQPCTDGAVVPPEQWPLVGAAQNGHCTAAETVFFSCPTSATKVLSLCGGTGKVQYRFGPPGAPELVHPADHSPAAFSISEESTIRAQATVVRLSNGEVTYAITDSAGGSGGPDAESNNFQGVYVYQNDELLADVRCTESPQTDWAALSAVIAQTP